VVLITRVKGPMVNVAGADVAVPPF
jgi:hypothetical protein